MGTATRTWSVLVVDDDTNLAEHLGESLVELGYDVAGYARSGAEALRAARETRPDVVLLDITLDGPMRGTDVALELLGDIPVVFMSGASDGETLAAAAQSVPLAFLSKPFTPAALRSTLEIARAHHDHDRQRAEGALSGYSAQAAAINEARVALSSAMQLAMTLELSHHKQQLEQLIQDVRDQAQSSERMRAEIAHGCALALVPIRRFASRLQREPVSADDLRVLSELADHASLAVEELQGICTNHAPQTRRQPVDLSALTLEVLAANRRVEPSMKFSALIQADLRVDGHPGQLRLLVDVMVRLAAAATREGDPTRIELVRTAGDELQFSFSMRADQSRGIGLVGLRCASSAARCTCLSLAQRIVSLHGGTLNELRRDATSASLRFRLGDVSRHSLH